ncbi:MAG: hypothetical protein AUI15_35060 [Actinobacteria bacterium 13_2_20CM_2_66_6]|nr:MAG: hypothetical protein AUI15_35060 [Actinobacteria bacterium 13_2_20CM_2_66_6]
MVGKTLAVARTRILRAHCRVGKVSRLFSTRKRKGRVLAERPRPGSRHRAGYKVNLTVGKGPRPRRR